MDQEFDDLVDQPKFACFDCGGDTEYKNRGSLMRHFRRHHENNYSSDIDCSSGSGIAVECFDCGNIYDTKCGKESLTKHLIAVHNKQAQLYCDVCDVRKFDKQLLANHVLFNCRGLIYCFECNVELSRKRWLLLHFRLRSCPILTGAEWLSNERLFGCPICRARFACGGRAAFHMRHFHENANEKKKKNAAALGQIPPITIDNLL